MTLPIVVGAIASAVGPAVTKAVIEYLVKSNNIPVTSVQAPELKTDLEPVVERITEREVAKRVEPYIRNANNQEHWWQSRMLWGGMIASIAVVAGWNLTPEEVGYWTDLGISVATPLFAIGYALYGRFVPNKPLLDG